ncbi:hypothetical protein ACFPA8_00705 [Streptomyces ovatisporus]|uniref:TPM domain-containing protein n=1 Tax=Streptomyces ovatisporus TaxID=1128682 RepID=A0ABV8ZZ34_9ACTN
MSTEPARTPARRVPCALAATALALLALGCLTAPARAAPPSPGEKIADALRESPVYVDPAYEQAVPPDRQRRLVHQIERTGLPLYVVLVPLVEGDPWGGESKQLTEVVHDRMGGGANKEYVFITTSETGSTWLDGREWPGEKHQAREAASVVGFEDEMKEKSLGARVARAVEIVESGDGRELYEEATADLGGEGAATGGGSGERGEEEGGRGPGLLPLLLVPAGLALVGGGAFFVVRRRRSAAPTPFSSPNSVFASARAADERGLRRRAHDEVVAFGEELSEAEADGGTAAGSAAALQGALDAYAAAGTVLDAARGIPDLAGALALVSEGRDSLRAARAPAGRPARKALKLTAKQKPQPALPLCFFHPLHGRAARRIRWRPLGRRESLLVAACEECCTAVRTHRAPEVLTDRREGRDVPYFEVPADNSLWAATGYGSLGEETLTERVIRGDFSRTAKS